MERRLRRNSDGRTGTPMVCRRRAPDRRLLPHRPQRHSRREAMRASRTLRLVACVAAAFAGLAGAADGGETGNTAAAGGVAVADPRCPQPTRFALNVQGGTLCAL